MQDVFKYDALTFKAPQRTHWYTRLWPVSLGHGRFGRKRPQFQLYLVGYDPVGQLQRAASVGDVALVQKFINGNEHHINEFDKRGRTSLHYACAHNHPNVVAWLASNDCTDINIQDDKGCTPLIKATQMDNVECVSILLKQGADPHIVDFGGDAALHHAVVRGNITIAAKLLKYKANIDAKTKYGMTPYKLALYERQHQMAKFLIKNGAEAHSVMKPNRISENPDVPESRTEDKGSTSAIKEDNEISSSSHTVQEAKPEGFLPENYDDGAVPQRHADTKLPSFQGPAGPPVPPLVHSISSINGPGGAPGPRCIPQPVPPRDKLRTPQKPHVPPPLPPRDISSQGPTGSISQLHPRCMPPGQPHQVKTESHLAKVQEAKPEGFLPENYDYGIVPQRTADTKLPSFQGPAGPPVPPLVHSISSINGPGGAPGPRCIPPPVPPRDKLRTPQKPPVPPPLPPRDISSLGPTRSISQLHPRCMPPGQPHQVKTESHLAKVQEAKPEGFLPENYDYGIVPQHPADTKLPSFQGPAGPPVPPLVHSISSINGPGGAPGPRCIPPPVPPRDKLRTPQKPPVPPPLPPRDISSLGPTRSISQLHPRCMPPGQPHQVKTESHLAKVQEAKPEGFLPENYDDGAVPQRHADTKLPSFQGPAGPPVPPLVHSISSINGPGGAPGPRCIPPPVPPRDNLRTPQKPPVAPPLPPRDISSLGPTRSISQLHPRCMPPGQPHQVKTESHLAKVQEAKPEGFLPENYDDGAVPQHHADTKLPSFQGPAGPPVPPLVHSISSINGPGGAPGPRCIPPPVPPRDNLRTPQKPHVPPPLPPRDISSLGPTRSISQLHPRCMPPGQPHQVQEAKPEGFLPENYDDGAVPQRHADTKLPSFQGPAGPPVPPLVHSISSINGPGGAPGPRCIPQPVPPRDNLRTPQKPPVPPPLQPRIISLETTRSIRQRRSRRLPPGQPHRLIIEIHLVKVEETKPYGVFPANYDDGAVPQPTADTELPSYPGLPGPPGPPLLSIMGSINGPERSSGPCRIPQPSPPRSKLWPPQKPRFSPPLPPQNISPGPPRSIRTPFLPCMAPLPPRPRSHPEGDAFDPQSANEYFSATNPAEYTHYATHSKVLPLWEATMALLMLTTGLWFLRFVSTVMRWAFNLI